ncbi:hypothetical protein [Clostridium chromiireducens]|uniref:Uncharacterized protein n=1 Tax=Clostridium chromiireducens TaxID=225345 RepID=A0A1V4IJ93_9CLOT|nr:hypothetical protein [Clostridium chromiireducens]OPJ60068.1 hypothetical protein CLCHR_31440 [Clostridium chromiireducens]
MIRKKRGSSLIMVVIISGILITVGTAMLSMSVGDYKRRVVESTRIKNLYSSESGLDAAYNILVKTFDAAAIYGVNEIERYKETEAIINIDTEIQEIKDSTTITNKDEQIKEQEAEKDRRINEHFKEVFSTFIYKENAVESVNSDIPTNEDELRKSINGKKYVAFNEDGTEAYRHVTLNVDDGEDDEADLSVAIEGNYKITITSNYRTIDTNVKATTKRTLQSTYNMTVPNYKDIVFSERKVELPKYTFLNDKAIIVGGNMNVIDSPLSVTGNIFIQGNGYNDIDVDGIDRAYNKYNGGIVLDASTNKKKVIFNGDVVTGKTFNIRNYVESTINGNLYAMNVYAGNENAADDSARYSTLYVSKTSPDKIQDVEREVVVDNDITLKADNTNIIIDKFFGINDKNLKYSYETRSNGRNESDRPLGRTSSSIIVNAHQNSGVKIITEAYIMGVAHINTDKTVTTNGYTTGESTGVKGNYIAYALPDVDQDGNIESVDNYGQLQLLKEDNVIIKSEYFKKYWEGKLPVENTGGIELPETTRDHPERKTWSLGARVYKDSNNVVKVEDSSYRLNGIPSVIGEKQKIFASKVYHIDGETLTDTDLQALYDALGHEKDEVSDLMSIENALQSYKDENPIFFKNSADTSDKSNQRNNNEKAIFTDKDIIITASDTEDIESDANSITIKVHNSTNTLNAFVATSGKVTIDGNVNFKGNIIAECDLDITGSDQTTIEYNKELSDRIQASNVDLFSSVFGNGTIEAEPGTTLGSLNVEYDVNKFIKNGIWKIV